MVVILLSLFFSVWSYEQDLKPFEWIHFSKVEKEYNLFLEASRALINISIIRYDSSDSFNYFYIYEFPSKNGQYSNVKQYNYNEFDFKYYDFSSNISNFLYKITNDTTNFISIKFIPKNTISLIGFKLDIYGGSYNLLNGYSHNFYNIKEDYDYYYCINIKQFQLLKSLNYMEIKPINYISIYEYRDKNNTSLYIKKDEMKFVSEKKGDNLTSLFIYEISSKSTNYVVLSFKPKYDIEHISIRMNTFDCFDCSFDLTYMES